MFIGHYAVALAAKSARSSISLATLFVASQLVDLVWPIFLLLGVEHVRIDPGNTAFTPLDFYHYPFTHSLLFAFLWSVGFAGIYWILKRDIRGASVIGACVASHWLLDLLTHGPDLPLAPGSSMFFGLGLWNNPIATIAVELGMFVVGIWMYLRVTQPRNRMGDVAFWGLIAFFVMIWAGNIFGPPPPSANAIAIAGNAMWLFVLWAWWIERNRLPYVAV